MISFDLKLCLIGSLPSTGSTLFAHQLSQYKNIYIGPELGLFSHPVLWFDFDLYKTFGLRTNFFFDFSDYTISELLKFGILGFSATLDKNLDWYGVSRSDVINTLEKSFTASEYIHRLRSLFQVPSDAVWFEKTPQNIYALNKFIEFNQKSCKVIVCTRNFRDTFVSYFARAKDWSWSYNYLGSSLSAYYSLARANYDSAVNVEYCKLVTNPTAYVDKILSSVVGSSFDLSRSSQYNKPIITEKSDRPATWSLAPGDKISLVRHSFYKQILNDKSLSQESKYRTCLAYLYLYHYISNENPRLPIHKSNLILNPGILDFSILRCIVIGRFKYTQKPSVSAFLFDVGSPYFVLLFYLNKFAYEQAKRFACFLVSAFKKVKQVIKRAIKIIISLVKVLFFVITKIKRYILIKIKTSIYFFLPMLRRISYDLSRKIKTFCLDIFFNYNRLARHVIIKNKDHSDVDLAICVAADGRVPMILLQCEEIYHAILRYNLRIKFIVSVSTLDDISQLYIHQKKYSFLIPIMIANRPLGRKWQETVNFVRDNISTLSLMINGSDDIASADYIYNGFKQVEVAISDQNFIVMPYYWHAYDSSSKKLYYLSYQPSQKIPLGAGRIFPLRFLEIINWNIFDPFLESQLDNKAYLILSRCSNFSFVNLCQNQGVLLSVKSASSLEMNPLDAILKASTIDYRLLDSSQFKLLSSSFSSSLMRNFLES